MALIDVEATPGAMRQEVLSLVAVFRAKVVDISQTGMIIEASGNKEKVEAGAFAHEWMKESRTGRKRFEELAGQTKEHQIERVGAELRGMMPWLAAGRLVDKARN